MSLSTRTVARACLGLRREIRLGRDLFGRLGELPGERALRGQLENIRDNHCHFALPPKYVPPHPRLSPLAAIHFDHYNSSVTDLPAPVDAETDASLARQGVILGISLNFLQDADGDIYGFGGNIAGVNLDLSAKVSFKLILFDSRLEKEAEHEIVALSARDLRNGDLPLNLGYFVMDNHGRVIVIENDTDIVFLKKNAAREIETVRRWPMCERLRSRLAPQIANQVMAQVFPDFEQGYWIMALGSEEDGVPAYAGRINDEGEIEDVHNFTGEIIENGMAVDASGAYIVTDHAIYKFSHGTGGSLNIDWRNEYRRASVVKPGTENLSRHGSGSTPTLLGDRDDLVAYTDNADERVNLVVLDRASGEKVCEQPLFEAGASANENTVVGYGDSIIVQNWYGSPPYDGDLLGLKPGLWRVDVYENRSGCEIVWQNDEFATSATIRLSTRTGLLYGTVQTGEDDQYAMAFVDFQSGETLRKVPMPDNGKGYRISMSPAYVIRGGRILQPVRRGMVVFRNP